MEQLFVKLENCYWINSLEYLFDFEKSNVYSLYASNGTMKTSFLNTFLDISEKKQPKDYINNIEWTFTLKDWKTQDINPTKIFPIKSMDISFQPNDMSLLIVNKKSKDKYDKIYSSIMKWQYDIVFSLNKTSKIVKDNIIPTILNDFRFEWWNFLDFLESILDELKIPDDLSDIVYKDIFSDQKVLDLLWNADITENIEKYDRQYKSILNEYSCYEEGVFTPFKAEILIKAIETQEFLSVDTNWINLWWKNFSKLGELKKEVAWSFRQIEKDVKLRTIKEKISKWTKAVKTFQTLVETKGDKIIPKLIDQDKFKKDLWIYYFSLIENDIIALLKIYNEWKAEMQRIQDEARGEQTIWNDVVNIFQKRFSVPFQVSIKDRENTILWTNAPVLDFKFFNKKTWEYDITKTKTELLSLETLSWGEKRALYLLNIMFEIEIRKNQWWKHLLIIDDIADSFDYKNKYAILEYLHELKDDTSFNLIILTHNFDFYRNIQMRLWLKDLIFSNWDWANLTINKDIDSNIDVISWFQYLDPINDFRQNCHECDYKLIALIPVARNLIEYMLWNESDDYVKFTWMLHVKNTEYKIADIITTFKRLFNKDDFSKAPDTYTKEFIYNLCDNLIDESEDTALEKKIVLSIWIRLLAEDFMRKKLWNIEKAWIQTRLYYNDCVVKKLFQIRKIWKVILDEEKIIKKVLLMTPEAIHVNSFMYEPILDMWDLHLKDLYREISSLL